MDREAASEQLADTQREWFKTATFEAFFGDSLLDRCQKPYYRFHSDQKGDAVCLLQKDQADRAKGHYEILRIPEEAKFGHNPIIPRLCSFSHSVKYDLLWADERTSDIESLIRQGGRDLGKMLNKAYAEVLLEASSLPKNRTQDNDLDQLVSEIYSDLVKDGFSPEVFLYPKHLKTALLQRGMITADQKVRSAHYTGTATGDLAAYWSTDLPDDTALIMDTSIGVALSDEDQFGVSPSGFQLQVWGVVRRNPIVTNPDGLIRIEGIDRAPPRHAIGIHSTEIVYVNEGRIEELRGIFSADFDLTKLIRLCEEINISYSDGCYLATAMLARALVDHIPPIFDARTFTEVANNYPLKSHKKSLLDLDSSLRNIADAHLHRQVRRRESLPNETQVDFRRELDVLLAEIVSKLG